MSKGRSGSSSWEYISVWEAVPGDWIDTGSTEGQLEHIDWVEDGSLMFRFVSGKEVTYMFPDLDPVAIRR